MRLQELFETTNEDRALISLSSAIYDKVTPYIGAEDYAEHLGKIGDIFNTPITALNDIKIDIAGGDEFIKRSIDPGEDPAMYEGKELLAFYDEDTRTIVLNAEFLDRQRMKTTITHELRHALDEIKSGSYPGNANRYFTPKKKEHRKDDSFSTTRYRARPAEINARFTEVLHKMVDIMPRRKSLASGQQLRDLLMNDLNHLLVKYEIADLFPEKYKSRDYKRLIKRTIDFIDRESAMYE